MSSAAFWQRGEALDYVNDTEDTIAANTVIVLGSRIGVIGTEIEPEETGSVHVTGVFEFDKTADEEIELGAEVYYDTSTELITATSGDSTIAAGFAAEASAADDDTVKVKINA